MTTEPALPRSPDLLFPALRAITAAAALTAAGCDAGAASHGPPAAATQPAWDDGAPLREHAEDVVDYTLHARLDPVAHTVHGEGRIHWLNTSDRAVREIWLHLYLNAFKNERSAFFRERVGGRGSAPPDDWGWIDVRRLAIAGDPASDLLPGMERTRPGDDDETDARVPLPRAVGPGESLDLDVAFDDKLPPVIERTGYRGRFHMVGQWFPKVARLERDGTWAHFPFHHLSEFYADFGTYDVTLDVPASFVLGATGPVVEEHAEGGRHIERHVQGDVHDFAWTAWDAWQTLRESIDGVDVRLLYPPGFAAVARRDMAAVRYALPEDSARFGRYPYAVLTVVHPPDDASEAGGMEYPTLITSGGSWMTPPGVLLPEIYAVHELGHQWFYGLVATDEAKWPFLDEGVNQFAEAATMERWRGPGSAVDLLGLRVSDATVQAVEGATAVHDEPVAQPAAAFSSGGNYGRLVYARTASVLETLARVYGRDALDAALGRYTRRYRFEHPSPEAFIAAFGEVLGPSIASTLRTALFDRGWVDYAVDGAWSRRVESLAGVFDRDGGRETLSAEPQDGWQGSVLVRRRGTLTFPVDVELAFADGSTRREHWDGAGDSTRIAWSGPSALSAALVDPDDRVVIDANLENNRAAVAGAERRPFRVLERATYWAEIALQTVSP
jgi:Peptidase family M1 domain